MSGLLEGSETTAAATPEPRTESEAPAPVVRGAFGALGPARTAAEFRKDRFLGKGTYGSVWKVTRIASGRIYALKEVDMRGKKQSEREESVNEIRLLASVRHPNIIRYRDSFFDNDHLFIVCANTLLFFFCSFSHLGACRSQTLRTRAICLL